MKKVLFCLQTMVQGGVEKELITVLRKMDSTRFQADVLLMYIQDNEIVKELPDWVRVIDLNIDKKYYCSSVIEMSKARLHHGNIIETVELLAKRMARLGLTQSNQSLKKLPKLEEAYDIAVCYHIHSPIMLKYVAEKVDAKKKVGWIHNDFLTTGYPIQRLKNILSCYDEFVAVSNAVGEEFKMLCPEYSENTCVIHNILDEDEIRELAELIPKGNSYFSDNRIKLLTVGRFTEQKGFDIAVNVCDSLRKKGLQFCWYMIGWGPEKARLKEMIVEKQLEDYAVILGQKKNPYPFIKQCDIYVQPSRHEAWGLVVHEARILHKPIICTHFAGSDEQIQDGETGYIVSIEDIDKLSEKISDLITDETARKRLSNNLMKHSNPDADFEKIIRKFEV